MLPEIGLLALILALILALLQGVLPLLGAARGDQALMAVGRSAAWGQFVFLFIAYLILTHAFLTHDFSVAYVASHSNLALPLKYQLSAVWGGHEGSLLLWALMLGFWSVMVTVFSRSLPADVLARVLGVMGLVAVGFIGFMVFTSSPFERLIPAPLDGRDLNPMLQDPGLIFHPPTLYMGYVGFVVPFAFAIAALLGGRLDAAWARWSRPWTAVAWAFLTLGIGLGSWWAYYELGWGGWWFWDPVENASLMPWLTGTALLHSLAVTEKRGTFKNWTVMLAILTFSLTLLGAFLVRSGVLTSVHAFAVDPSRGSYLLGYMAVVVGISLSLFAWRGPKVGLGGSFGMFSRETGLLLNNVILVVACAAVLLGTIYPLVLDALGLGKISVGPPYFESVFLPLMLPLMLLLGFGPTVRWKQDHPLQVLQRLRLILAFSLVVGMLWPLAVGSWSLLAAMGTFLGLWIMATIVHDVFVRLRQAPATPGVPEAESKIPRLRRLGLGYVGMQLAHFGMALMVVGITFVIGYDQERDVHLRIGETITVAGYDFRLEGIRRVQGPNYVADRGEVTVFDGERQLPTLYPEKRYYPSQEMPMTQASLNRGIFRDLYVSLGEPLPDGSWIARVYYKPYMNWVWLGCLLMTLGGLIAAADRRYRLKTAQASVAHPDPAVLANAKPSGTG